MTDRAEVVTGEITLRERYSVLFFHEDQKLHYGHGVEARIVKIRIGAEPRLSFEQPLADQGEELLFERRVGGRRLAGHFEARSFTGGCSASQATEPTNQWTLFHGFPAGQRAFVPRPFLFVLPR
jgi:hypothetical protein